MQIEELKALRNDEYEVKDIVTHKMKRGTGLVFKVRWKGYDKSHDTWEKKDNLNCPEILTTYLMANNLNV